jgi:uncharacterized protein
MSRYQTPGVYFEWLNTQPVELQIQRTDITGFVGICQRGPLHSPQKIESWTQFTSIFGGCIPQAYLAYAVQGFFANGGRTCHVVRVADPATTRHAWANIPYRTGKSGQDMQIAICLRSITPGTWAHQIDARLLFSGTERFSLTLRLPDGTQELWRDLELRNVEKVLNDEVNGSRLVKAFVLCDPKNMPEGWTLTRGPFAFQNGRDGLESLRPEHFSGNGSGFNDHWGLALLEEINEISILAMPDLMTKDIRVPQTYQPPVRCDVIPDANTAAPPGPSLLRPDMGSGPAAAWRTYMPIPGRQPYETKTEHDAREAAERAEAVQQADAAGRGGQNPGPVVDEYPPAFDDATVRELQRRMVLQCEIHKNRVAVLDPPRANMLPNAIIQWLEGMNIDSSYAALYYPWLRVPDPNGLPGDLRAIPPSGHVAGVYARVEKLFGSHKPPANELLASVQDVSTAVEDVIHGVLNEKQINVVRAYPGRGLRVAGARTLSSDSQWLYMNVRRLLIMIERSIDAGTQWIPFEPNNPSMWLDTERVITSFLDLIWRRGMLDGATAAQAYSVQCDEVTNPSEGTGAGRLLCLIGVLPPWAVEFIIARIGRTESGSQVLEG